MKLFMVCHDDGDSFDLLVRCETAEEAVDRWRQYHEISAPALPDQMFEVNPDKIGVLPWHTDKGMKPVTSRYHAVAEAAEALGIEDMQP
jgi:hypothetical protein